MNQKNRVLAPAQLARQSCAAMEVTAQRRQQKIVVENLSAQSTIRGDEALLRQVLEHLIGNALRYSPEGGALHVELKSLDNGRCRITVLDQGSGVPEDQLEKIFTPFFRGEGEKQGEGYGLGLAIARRVLAAVDGEIRAENRPQGGLAVLIELPVLAG